MPRKNKTKEQLSAELQSLRKQFNDFLDELPDALLEVDVGQGLTHMNRQTQRLFGYTAKDVADGIEIPQLFGQNEYDRAVKIINSYIAESQKRKTKYTPSQKQKLYEFVMRRKDGSLFHAETQTSFVLDGKGVPTGLRTVIRNITERKLAEAASHDLSQIMNSSPDCIFKSRIDNFKFTKVNKTACDYYGYSQEEFLKMGIFDIEVAPPLKEQVRKLYDTTPVGNVIEVFGTNKKKNGDTFPVHVRFLKLDEEFALANVRDITEQKMAEEELKKAKESAEAVNIELIQSNEALQREIIERKNLESQLVQAQKLESIGQLAAGIAHEINTPIQYVGDNTRFLNVAFGRIKTVLDKSSELINAAKEDAVTEKLITEVESVIEDTKMEYMLEEIPMSIDETLGGVERVATIVRAMKEFSHPGTEEKTLTDINRALENTITVARNEWKYVAELVKDFEPALPLVPCLPGELNQVFLNIIVNAAQAIADVVQDGSEGKGIIKVSTSSAGDWVEIKISDSGTGIPEEARSKVFDAFFTTKEVGKGTGQGLAIANNVVVKKHGGSLNFETEIGQGTMFVIRLPIKAPNN